jgi:hypothetical protein
MSAPSRSQAQSSTIQRRGDLTRGGPFGESITREPTPSNATEPASAAACASNATPGRSTRHASSGNPRAAASSPAKPNEIVFGNRARGGPDETEHAERAAAAQMAARDQWPAEQQNGGDGRRGSSHR